MKRIKKDKYLNKKVTSGSGEWERTKKFLAKHYGVEKENIKSFEYIASDPALHLFKYTMVKLDGNTYTNYFLIGRSFYFMTNAHYETWVKHVDKYNTKKMLTYYLLTLGIHDF